MTVGEFEKLLESRDQQQARAEKFRQMSNITDPNGPWRYRLIGNPERQSSTKAWQADRAIRQQPEWQLLSDHCVAIGGQFSHAVFHRVIAPFSVRGTPIREKTLGELIELLRGGEQFRAERQEADEEHEPVPSGQIATTAPGSNSEKVPPEVAALYLEPDALKLCRILRNEKMKIGDRMVAAIHHDQRCRSWKSDEWAERMGVTGAGVRKSGTWQFLQDHPLAELPVTQQLRNKKKSR